MTSAAAERPTQWTPDRRRGAARREQRDRLRTRAFVAAGLAFLVALLASAVILLDVSSNTAHSGASDLTRLGKPGMDVSGLAA